jgi:hypothetical protein
MHQAYGPLLGLDAAAAARRDAKLTTEAQRARAPAALEDLNRPRHG